MTHYTRKYGYERWFCSYLFLLLESLQHQQLLDFVKTLWCIWKKRNDKWWNDVETQSRILVLMMRDNLLQWQQVHVSQGRREQGEYRNNGMSDHSQEWWIRSVAREVKCNVDATIFKDQGGYGVGMCLRGEFIRAKTSWYIGLS